MALRARCGAVPDIKLNPFLRVCAIVAKVVDLDAAGNILEAARIWIKARAREFSCFTWVRDADEIRKRGAAKEAGEWDEW